MITIEATIETHSEFRGVKRTEISAVTQEIVRDDHAFLRAEG